MVERQSSGSVVGECHVNDGVSCGLQGRGEVYGECEFHGGFVECYEGFFCLVAPILVFLDAHFRGVVYSRSRGKVIHCLSR